MPMKKYKPTSPGVRGTVTSDYSDITRSTPQKSLTKGKKSTGGRSKSTGRISVRFRGGGVKRKLRKIDFMRKKTGVPAKVAEIEYDPNRTARIALLHYVDGEKAYILAPVGLAKGDTVLSGPDAETKPGNAMPLADIPPGTQIHNIELTPGTGAALVRSAGDSALLRLKEGKYAHVRLPSGEVRRVNQKCMATIGQVGNVEHMNINLGKAGRKRYLGKRPHVRGVVMNPVDHPMGGGEGKTSGGGHPVSPWSQLSKGYKTRKGKKYSDKLIVSGRKNKNKRRK
ncbi:MAG: 50S ribosomal protein L2 [Verrucomicrobiota bacterium]|nr:50S ribosomal protein L2 [Verrucomicrobiota bacterium]